MSGELDRIIRLEGRMDNINREVGEIKTAHLQHAREMARITHEMAQNVEQHHKNLNGRISDLTTSHDTVKLDVAGIKKTVEEAANRRWKLRLLVYGAGLSLGSGVVLLILTKIFGG